jgi:hypothetical protein
MKLAICFDECGLETTVECPSNETKETLIETFPEYTFRYWEDLDRHYEDQGDYYNPESDCYE